MLGERTRNVIVGLTIVVSLVVCVYGIGLLGKLPGNSLHEYKVTLLAPDANGVVTGSRVEFNGIDAGAVNSVYSASLPDNKLVVKVEVLIDNKFQIPASAQANLTRPQAVGNSYVAIKANSSKPPMLAHDGSASLNAESPSSELIPKEIFTDVRNLKSDLSNLAHELTTVASDLHVLLVLTPPESVDNPGSNPNPPKPNASTVILRLDQTVKNLQAFLTDPKLQGNVRTALQNIADASAQLKGVLQKVDSAATNATTAINNFGEAAGSIKGAATQASATFVSTQKEIEQFAQSLAETLKQIDTSIKQLTEGNGTTGKLVSDPRLYDGLLDLSNSLKSTVSDLDFLLKKWKDEGVQINLK